MKKAHNRIEIEGKTFNYWKVLSYSHTTGKTPYYLCECTKPECGRKFVLDGRNVRSGRSKNCRICGDKNASKLKTGVRRNDLSLQEMCVKYLYNDKKKSATNRGISWELNLEEFASLIFQNCYYSGLPPSTTTNVLKNQSLCKELTENGWITYNGLDRIDSSKGYIMGNVVPCNSKVNCAKNDSTTEEFLSWVKAICDHQDWMK